MPKSKHQLVVPGCIWSVAPCFEMDPCLQYVFGNCSWRTLPELVQQEGLDQVPKQEW